MPAILMRDNTVESVRREIHDEVDPSKGGLIGYFRKLTSPSLQAFALDTYTHSQKTTTP